MIIYRDTVSESYLMKLEEHMKKDRGTIIVVCLNLQQFHYFCTEKLEEYECENRKYEGVRFVFPTHRDSLRGLVASDVIYYGEYYRRDDLPQIKYEAMFCLRKK